MSGGKGAWPRPRWFYWALAGAIFVADQLSKRWVVGSFHLGESREVVPGFWNWTYVRNDGIAFGLFQGNNLALGIMTCALLAGAAWLARGFDWRKLEINVLAGLITGGALGNLADRWQHGFVVDFADVILPWYGHWPAFNVADSALSLSMVWLVGRSLLGCRCGVGQAGAAR